MQPIEERLELVRFKVDKTAHIRVNTETCQGCDTTPCVFVCPAGLFEILGNEMHFSYEHCLECGTCYVACERKAIEWEYPRGGWGVSSGHREAILAMEKGYLKLSELSNQHYLLTNQYNNAQKLEARIQLHRLFSTNRYSWFRWLFDHFALPPQSSLLELGCGPGYIWSKNADRIPAQWQITLSDFSPGMLQEVQQNLQGMERPFTFQQVDAQSIPFENGSFDAVIANHMLYHVPDRARALAEIHRVLKPGGVFYAATNGRHNMHELREITTRLVPSADTLWGEIAQDQTQPYFYLETGGAELAPWFSPVTIHHYDDALVVTEAQPLIAYILSTPIAALFNDELIQHAVDIVQREIDEKGAFHISKVSGLFEAHVA